MKNKGSSVESTFWKTRNSLGIKSLVMRPKNIKIEDSSIST